MDVRARCLFEMKLNLFSFYFQGEVDTLKLKIARLERENKELEDANEKLQQKVHNLLTVDLFFARIWFCLRPVID